MAKTKVKAAKKDALDQLAEGDLRDIIALLLWKNRHRNPSMAEQITEKDMQAFRDCTEYLKVEPDVRIERPLGRPAQEPIPASPGKRAVPGYAAEPPRPFVIVAVVEKGTENAIRPIENNVEDNNRRIEAERIQKARDQASGLARSLEAMRGPNGVISDNDILEAANTLRLLARA